METLETPDGTKVVLGAIRTTLYPRIEERVKKSAKRAKRLKVDPIELIEGEHFTEIEKKRCVMTGKDYTITHHFTRYTLIGKAPKLSGWKLIASIEPLGDEVIVNTVPGENYTGSRERVARNWSCDHCNTKRFRKELFAVEHDDGRSMIVGRNCISDFLGGKEPEQLATVWALLGMTRDEEGGWGFGGFERERDITEMLTATFKCIALWGWTPRNGGYGTADDAIGATTGTLFDTKGCDAYQAAKVREKQADYEACPVDEYEVSQAIAWAEECDQDEKHTNDYLMNLGAIARNGGCPLSKWGYGCSILSSFRKARDKESQYKARKEATAKQGENSEHFGEIKKRSVYEFTILSTRDIESDFGSSTLYKFEDADQNVAAWFCSGRDLYTDLPLDSEEGWLIANDTCRIRKARAGDTVKVKATIKQHSEFNGVKETQLSRVAAAN